VKLGIARVGDKTGTDRRKERPLGALYGLGRGALALVTVVALSGLAVAGPPGWGDTSEVETIVAITQDEDGELKETKIWLAELDARAFIRTSKSSNWGDNIARNPQIALRVAGEEHPVRITFVENKELRKRIEDAFRAKYGFNDALVGLIRGRNPRIMEVDSR
jgi:hypothetical protein